MSDSQRPAHSVKLVDKRLLRGPNRHANHPVLVATIDEGDSGNANARDDGMATRLQAMLAPHAEAGSGACAATLGGAVAWTSTVLQRAAGSAVADPVAADPVTGVPGRWRVVVAYEHEAVASQALALALEWVAAARDGTETTGREARLRMLRALAARESPSPMQASLIAAAARRGVPVLRLADDPRLLQFGWGARAQRVFGGASTGTGQVATDLTGDRALTREMLAQAGLPVPRGEIVGDRDAAVAVASRLGRTVVLKPARRVRASRSAHGTRAEQLAARGITLGVAGDDAVRAAFDRAAGHGRRVLVERHIAGGSWRAHVVADRVLSVERLDRRPTEGDSHGNGNGNGTGCAVERAAPEASARLPEGTARACVRAARAIGLDAAAVDFICADIAQPLESVRGAVIAVRAAPDAPMTEAAADAFLESLLATPHGGARAGPLDDAGDGRIPLIAVTGTNGKTTTTLAIAHIVQCAGLTTGVTTTEGVFIAGQPVTRGDCTGYFSARTVLTDPQVQAAVLETARGGLAKRGLAFDRSTVGVVLNVQGDHLGQDGIRTIEELAHLKGLVARTAGRAVVLNADDPLCVPMAAQRPPGCEAVYFSMRPPMSTPAPAVAAHLAGGGRAVLLGQDADGQETIALVQAGSPAVPLALVDRLPMTFGGLARHNVANALAAVAATWAAGFPVERIRAGLAAFRPGEAANPLRLNVFRVGGTTVVVDYAHNRGACAAIIATARALSGGRVVGIVSAPGDRIDEELDEVGRVAARGFDEVVVYEKDDKRGRAPGEITRRIGEGARHAGIDPARLHTVGDQRAAIRAGLALCRPGDLLVYAGATDIRDLHEAAAAPVDELVIVERRSPLAADGRPTAPGPTERRVDRRPYLLTKSASSSISTSR